MAADYGVDHPSAHLPDLTRDNNLSQEAHNLLDNPNTWREKMRDIDSFRLGMILADNEGLDKNKDQFVSDSELLRFVNDDEANPLARQAVEVMRENPEISKGRSSGLEMTFIVDQATLNNAENADFRQESVKEMDQSSVRIGLGITAAAAAFGGGFSLLTAPPLALPMAGIFGTIGALSGVTSGIISHFDTIKNADNAHANAVKINRLDLFDTHGGSLENFDQYRPRYERWARTLQI